LGPAANDEDIRVASVGGRESEPGRASALVANGGRVSDVGIQRVTPKRAIIAPGSEDKLGAAIVLKDNFSINLWVSAKAEKVGGGVQAGAEPAGGIATSGPTFSIYASKSDL